MFLSLVVTLFTLIAVLFLLVNLFTTACYTARTPSGADAMGLIVPLLLSAIGGIVLLIATWVGVGRGWFNWISMTPMVPFSVTTAISLGVGFLAVALLVAWAERMGRWVVPAGAICGGLGPMVLAGIIIASAWTTTDQMAASTLPWIAGGFVAAVALIGYVLGFYAWTKQMKMTRENQARAMAEHLAREAEWERKRKRSPMEELKEDFAEMSPQTPLWVFASYLPTAPDQACRSFIIERMLKVPDLDAELARTIISQYPRYRHGCIDLMRYSDQWPVKAAWPGLLALATKMTVEEITADPQWLRQPHDMNPLPKEHLAAIDGAAARIEAASMMTEELKAALEAIRKIAR